LKTFKGSAIRYADTEHSFILNTDKTSTQTELAFSIAGVRYSATGSSWRVTGDTYDEATGSLLAVYRAVKQMENILRREVEALDHVASIPD